MRRNYYLIDFLRLFFAICIVFMHTEFYIINTSITLYTEKLIFRLGVPFFFVVSGFFLAESIRRKHEIKNTIRSYVIKLLITMLFFELLNIAIELFLIIRRGSIEEGILEIIKHVLFYPYGSMWYAQAVIVGTIMTVPFLLKNKINIGLSIGGILYIFALLSNNYYFVAQILGIDYLVDLYLNLFFSARNGVFVGFIFILFGIKINQIYYSYNYETKVKLYSNILLLSYLVYFAEVYLVKNICNIYGFNIVDDGSMYASYLFLIPSIVLVCLKYITTDNILIYKAELSRYYSTGIYFIHRLVYRIIFLMMSILEIGISKNVISVMVLVSTLFFLFVCLHSNNFIKQLLCR